jgi:hypothetical protein
MDRARMAMDEDLLRAVLPWLVTKRERAELALRALEHRSKSKGVGGWSKVHEDHTFVAYVEQMRDLNRKGPQRGD